MKSFTFDVDHAKLEFTGNDEIMIEEMQKLIISNKVWYNVRLMINKHLYKKYEYEKWSESMNHYGVSSDMTVLEEDIMK